MTTSTSNIVTQNKDIFIDHLLAESKDISFLRVVCGNKTDMKRTLGERFYQGVEKCPNRETDIYCINKNPQYRIIEESHFKPTDFSYYKSNRCEWIRDAIRATWEDYDPTIPYDHGDISKMVWYRYRQARRHVRQEDERRKKEEAERIAAEWREMKRIANLKKREKEDQQYLDLAARNPRSYKGISRFGSESERDWGMRCFNSRMRVDQRIKNAKVKESPNEAALIRVRQWLRNNPNFDDYGTDLADERIAFSYNDSFSGIITTSTNSKRYKIPHTCMSSVLSSLATYGFTIPGTDTNYKLRSNSLSVTVTVDWPKVNNEGFPNNSEIGYATSKYSWTKLQGNDRTPTPIIMQIQGMFWNDDHVVLISNKTRSVRKMFPREYSEFEYMNNSNLVTLRECRKLPKEYKITNIKVHVRSFSDFPYLEFRGATMTEEAIKEWRNEVKYTSATFPRYYYDLNDPTKKRHQEREAKVDDTLTRVRAAKAAKVAAARQVGLINKTHLGSSLMGVGLTLATERIDKLMDLLNLKDRGVISDEEYTKLKAALL